MEEVENKKRRFHILIVDDDTKLRNLLAKFLDRNGFFVATARNPKEAMEQMNEFIFDLMILDVMMPEENGIDFARKIRDESNTIPILMLTALGESENKIEGLETGVDDYLTKPFNPKELLLRIKNIIRRSQKLKDEENICRFGEFEFNIDTQNLKKSDYTLHLTDTEATILKIFCNNVNKILSRAEISKLSGGVDERSVDVQITRIRKKIENNARSPEYLQTVRGKGYIFKI